jgi:hypothetical protein
MVARLAGRPGAHPWVRRLAWIDKGQDQEATGRPGLVRWPLRPLSACLGQGGEATSDGWVPGWRMAQRLAEVLNREWSGHALGSTTELRVHWPTECPLAAWRCLHIQPREGWFLGALGRSRWWVVEEAVLSPHFHRLLVCLLPTHQLPAPHPPPVEVVVCLVWFSLVLSGCLAEWWSWCLHSALLVSGSECFGRWAAADGIQRAKQAHRHQHVWRPWLSAQALRNGE